MIDAHTEALLSLGQACRAIPGGTVSISTIHRWVLDGVRGAKLETIKVGHRRLTSREAITRFIQAQNPESTTEPAITSSHHIQPSHPASDKHSPGQHGRHYQRQASSCH